MDADTKWVFGYGSLIWRPGFPFLGSEVARLIGAHRSLSVISHGHRGTLERPGLVFGLIRGGSCRGMAFAVAPEHWAEVRDYLRQRELGSGVYREAIRPVRLASGLRVPALAFVVDEGHPQFAGRLDVAQQVRRVREARGASGSNVEYVLNTARHLAELGIGDPAVEALAALLEEENPGRPEMP